MPTFLLLAVMALLAACSAAQTTAVTAQAVKVASSPAGTLFCQLQTVAGPIVVAAIDAEASAVAPSAAPVAVLATGASKQFVDATCAAAATAMKAAAGAPVSPPADMSTTVPAVPVTVPRTS